MNPTSTSTFSALRRGHMQSALWLTAGALRSLGQALDRAAARLDRTAASRARIHVGARSIEFYAEAGAAEGAIYVDGQLLGCLPGVTRL